MRLEGFGLPFGDDNQLPRCQKYGQAWRSSNLGVPEFTTSQSWFSTIRDSRFRRLLVRTRFTPPPSLPNRDALICVVFVKVIGLRSKRHSLFWFFYTQRIRTLGAFAFLLLVRFGIVSGCWYGVGAW